MVLNQTQWSTCNLQKPEDLHQKMISPKEMKIFRTIPPSILGKLVLDVEPNHRKKINRNDGKTGVILAYINSALCAIEACLQNVPDFQKHFDEFNTEMRFWPDNPTFEIVLRINLIWKIIIRELFLVKNCTFVFSPRPRESFYDTVHLCKLWKDSIKQQTEYLSKCMKPHTVDLKQIIYSHIATSSTEMQSQEKTKADIEKLKQEYHMVVETIKQKEKLKNIEKRVTNAIKNAETNTNALKYDSKAVWVELSSDMCSLNTIKELNNQILKLQEKVEILKKQLRNYECNLADQVNKEKAKIFDRLDMDFDIDEVFKIPAAKASDSSEVGSCDKPINLRQHQHQQTMLEEFLYEQEPPDVKLKDRILSECNITFKTGTSEEFRDISVLQVIHKTNQMSTKELRLGTRCRDPTVVLTGVRHIFNKLLEKECCQLKESERNVNKFSVEARSYEIL